MALEVLFWSLGNDQLRPSLSFYKVTAKAERVSVICLRLWKLVTQPATGPRLLFPRLALLPLRITYLVTNHSGWLGMTRDDSGWLGMIRDDSGWLGMTRVSVWHRCVTSSTPAAKKHRRLLSCNGDKDQRPSSLVECLTFKETPIAFDALATCADWLQTTFSLLSVWPVYNVSHHLGDAVVESSILLVSNQSQPMITSWKHWAGKFWLIISHPYMWLYYDPPIFKNTLPTPTITLTLLTWQQVFYLMFLSNQLKLATV